MAARNNDFMETLGRRKVTVSGSFKPNGASAIDNTLNKGKGFTVAYTATGVYTVTFADTYGAVASASASLRQETRTQDVEVASCTGSTMIVHGFARGATVLADITAATNTRVDFEVVFDDSVDN